MTSDRDPRRYGVIEVRRINAETYLLTIDGRCGPKSNGPPSRQRWCIQDAAGQCLTHTEHIVGQNPDVQTAIRIAKRMIIDGSMPTPEEAHAQLEQRHEREHLGEPMELLQDTAKIEAIVKPE